MSTESLERLAAFLEERAALVRGLESEAAGLLHGGGDQKSYEEAMRRKAELLAALAEDAAPLLEGLDAGRAEALARRLKAFSRGAANSLRVKSVFYMSALLYPEDYVEGAKNDLENFIDEVRRA
ncbi:hypothetical protein [Desulfovibrio sp.]